MASMAADSKTYTLEECQKHTSETSCWLQINGRVYDVTEFLEEHPGGYDIIIASAGKDATQDFDEIGHSNSAKDLLEKYYIGALEGGAPAPAKQAAAPTPGPMQQPKSGLSRLLLVLLPVVVLALAMGLNVFLRQQ